MLLSGRVSQAEDWPQWMGPKRDGVWRETGVLDTFGPRGARFRWRVPVGGGFSSPSVTRGRVYLSDRPVAAEAPRPGAFETSLIPGTERVLCLDAASGKTLWKHVYDCPYTISYASGPRAAPAVERNRVYTMGAMGNMLCLETSTGHVVWAVDFKRQYGAKAPVWGWAAAPLLEGNGVICLVGGEGALVVSFDKRTGREIWRGLSAKEPGYCPPVVYEFGGRRHLVIWHPEAVTGLDPATGAVLWTVPWSIRSGLTVSMPRQSGNELFLTSFYNGSTLLRFTNGIPSVVWQTKKASERDTTHLHSIISTPFIEGDYVYGSCSYGQYRCLRLSTGERLWESFLPTGGKQARWANAFTVKNGSRFVLFSETGELILAKLSPSGFEELSRAAILDPTNPDPGRKVVWSLPAFANRSLYARNDEELVCVDLSGPR